MRLIDADKLRTFSSINKGNFNSVETIQKWVDNAETVKAIPTEWIKEYIKDMLDKRAIFQIEVMIERWEKNETN